MANLQNPVKAIGEHCLHCCGDSYVMREQCASTDCELYPFRFGKNPFHKQSLTDEQRAERSRKMKELRAAQFASKSDD